MDELPAGRAEALGPDCELALAVAGHCMSRAAAADPGELFDVEMDELVGGGFLMSRGTGAGGGARAWRWGGSGGSRRERLPSPIRLSAADTVESAIPSTSAISAPVIRNCRRLSIALTRSGAVRCGIRFGADDRSNRPALPSARQRASQR